MEVVRIVLAMGVGLLLLAAAAALIYLPVYFAKKKNHPQLNAIAMCTFLSLFFPPLWIVAIIWAAIEREPPK
ncbi:MAG TPA: DUF3302 domain-containing protein [Pirellulales bacterium]